MGPLIALAIVALPGGIHGELFAPDGGGRHAAVVLLHGGAGLTRRGSDFRAYARDLARNGFVVLLPHYFDATHSETIIMLRRSRARCQPGLYRRPRPGVTKVSLLGFSLGAFLAVSLGAEVDAIVDYYGGISELAPLPAKLPPTLIVHGEADSTVPVSEARRLAAVLEERHVAHEMHLYPEAEHVFDAKRAPGSAGADAWRRALAFLRVH